MQSNEFYGATLAEAVKKATASYRRAATNGENRFCSQLRYDFERQKNLLDRLQHDIADLESELKALEREANRARLRELALSLVPIISGLRKWRGIINLIRRFKLDREAWNAIERNWGEVGAVISATLFAAFNVTDYNKIDQIKRDITKLQSQTQSILAKLSDLARSYLNGNCHLQNLQS